MSNAHARMTFQEWLVRYGFVDLTPPQKMIIDSMAIDSVAKVKNHKSLNRKAKKSKHLKRHIAIIDESLSTDLPCTT
jgi:hypothetical protein